MPKLSAGLLLYRLAAGGPDVLLVHPGGPFYARKDDGVWSVPKGEHDADEDPQAVALREFEEELGAPPPLGPFRTFQVRVADIAELTGARTLDALHLAAAQRVGGSAVGFVTFDLRQAQAARILGMTVLPG